MGEERKAAIVTGAAGGVGREVVRRLLDRGYGVVAEDVSPAVVELAEDGPVAALEADVGRSGSARRAVELATSRFGRLDLLVNNAARFLRRSAAETTDEDFDRLVATNLRGAFLHAREALAPLAATRGAIVNVASISGLIGMPNQVAYAMTKGGLVQLTRQLAIEQAERGIRVNAVAPGTIDTDFIAEARAADPDPEATLARTIDLHPLGRLLTAAEVAEAIVFLASDAASGITGEILAVDAGFMAR